MKLNKTIFYTLVFLFSLAFVSCEDNDEITFVLPTEIVADNKWVEDEISNNDELWYKISCEPGSTTAYLEWAENGAHGEDRNYTGDIKVSAYYLDGVSAYIEDKDNGYGEKSKSFQLANNETEFLVKVTLGATETPGSFALRAKTTSVVDVSYSELQIEDNWIDSTITQNEIVAFKVKYEGEKRLKIIWAEIDSPESGYTADVVVSVLHSDGLSPYKDLSKNKDFLDKNKSHSNEPKYIQTNPNDGNIKIHVKNTVPGTFAIKVVEFTE